MTYVPGAEGPLQTKFRGVVFQAHVPKKVNADIVDALKGNRFFQIGVFDPDKIGVVAGDPPKTHVEYRGHVANWLKSVGTLDELASRWAKDRNLRAICQVDEDDLRYLGTLIEPKLAELTRAEGLKPTDMGAIFVKHGIFELPWRV
ncbi:MAG: hypothetical protein P4M05_19575 [Bradyrhizobium sp.]|nr:hypothetical protein [Bradyrhizobium sp.]